MLASQACDQGKGQRVGPYLLHAEIGRGATGVVYEAVQPDTGERVAVKMVRVAQAELLSSIRREIHTLSRLRHPGVVRIVGEGIADGQPWYAMKLLQGPTLRLTLQQQAQTASRPPQALAKSDLRLVLDLVRRVCEALGSVHAEGIVHGDIKPENIFIEPGNQPVLVDFGLAWQVPGAHSREVLDAGAAISGTAAYMAPEQIAGESIDARADFYSLGCVLYELLAGRPPFFAADPARLLTQHLSVEPPPPSSIDPAVPAALDALVAGLLKKKRRDRLGYAEDIIAEIDRVIAETPVPEPPLRPMRYLYRPDLAGRDALLAELLALAERARDGSGACVLIGGESGIGKTYLSAELVRRRAAGIRAIVNSCVPVGGGAARGGQAAPLQSLRGLLQGVADRCAEGGEEVTDRLLGARGATLAAYEPSLASLPGQAKFPPRPPLQGAAARDHLIACSAETLAAMAEDGPVLLVIDDLQWADELTLRLLRTLPDGWFAARPLLLLGTYRSEEAPPEIAAIRDRSDARHIELGGVDAASVGLLIVDMLALKELSAGLAELLARQSQGNPFYIAEYLRIGIAEGVLLRTRERTLQIGGLDRALSPQELAALPLPQHLRDLVLRRIGTLSPPARALVDVAAVLGGEFEADLLRLAAGLGELETMDAMAELLRRQTIEHAGAGKLRFVHDKLNEIAYANLPGESRGALHERVALALEQRPGGVRPADQAALAHHWSRAGREDRELYYRDLAGATALAAAAFAEAAQHFGRALQLADRGTPLPSGPVPPSLPVKWEANLAQAEHARGDVPAAEAHAVGALERVGYRWPQSVGRWLFLLLAQLPSLLAHRWGLRWRRLASDDECHAVRSAARAAELLAHRYFYVENMPAMLASAFLAANLAERAEAQNDVPKAYISVAFLARTLGLARLASHYLEVSRRGVEQMADPVQRADGLTSQSVYHATFGEWKAAEDAALAAADCMRDARDPFMLETVWTTVGHVEYFTGRPQAAYDHYAAVLRSARARANVQHVPWGLFAMARSLVAFGRHTEAIPLLAEADAALAERPELQSEITCKGLLALARLKIGDVDGARRSADQAAILIRRARPTGFPTVEGYSATADVYIELLAGCGQDAQRRSLERSLRLVLRALRQFAWLIPMARPMLALREGRHAACRGRLRLARRRLTRALQVAQRLGMPHEQAQAHIALAALAAPGSVERTTHREAARRGLAAMGCEPDRFVPAE